MSTGTDKRDRPTARKPRPAGGWTVPVVGVLAGGVYLAVFLARGQVLVGLSGLGIMLAYVAVTTLLGGRWEAAAVLGGDTGDERRRSIDERAAAATLRVLAPVLVIGFFVSVARGTGAMTWAALCAVAGGVYIAATVILTRRG